MFPNLAAPGEVLCGQSGLLGLEECAAVTRARHQREADLFVPLQALAIEKILTCLDTSQACVSARVVLTLPRCMYYNTHLPPL